MTRASSKARAGQSSKSPIATPADILKSANAKWSKFIKCWISGEHEEMFPMQLRVSLKVSTRDTSLTEMMSAVQLLNAKSKSATGAGYTVVSKRRKTRDWGEQNFPHQVTIDTPDDLVSLLGKRESFGRMQLVCERVRQSFPELESWLVTNANKLEKLPDVVNSLIVVCKAIQARPLPDCYLRQLNVPVDTKFIEKHETTLRQWLDKILPASSIRVQETTNFARRYGLRDGLPHHLIRVLDPALLSQIGLPVDELSLPMRHLSDLNVADCTVIVVENRTNLLTLPRIRQGIALGGVGDAATRLRDIDWLGRCRLVYWGDIDVDGFRILANMRKIFPEMESVLMGESLLDECREHVVEGNGKTADHSMLLNADENAALERCSQSNLRLEQEKIPQSMVDRVFASDDFAHRRRPNT